MKKTQNISNHFNDKINNVKKKYLPIKKSHGKTVYEKCLACRCLKTNPI